MCLMVIGIILSEVPVRFSREFLKIRFFIFSCLLMGSTLYILNTLSITEKYILCKYLLSLCDLVSTLLMVSFG